MNLKRKNDDGTDRIARIEERIEILKKRKQKQKQVNRQQDNLKEQKKGRPDRGAATVPGQNVPRYHRLYLE
jgi:hypothetical protein